MKQKFIILVMLMLAVCCAANAQSNISKNKSVEQKFMQLQRAEDKAEAKKDVAALERIFSDDFVFVAANGAFYDKKKFIDEIKNDTEPAAVASVQVINYEDFKVRVYGKTAVVNYVLAVSDKDKDGKDYVNRYRMSAVWIKQKGDWRLANIHATRVRS